MSVINVILQVLVSYAHNIMSYVLALTYPKISLCINIERLVKCIDIQFSECCQGPLLWLELLCIGPLFSQVIMK